MSHLDADIDKLKQKLRDLFAMFSAFAQTRYNETNEVSIYNSLLGFEEGRLADNVNKVQVSSANLDERCDFFPFRGK